ncbi:uncharacterized protein LOC101853808 [Aplysia californica]|uniref:Uncharacterized protein LOC101853808 n=1 Tax=Aplysia californica TaxID=6500 RepID=A0ABM1A6U5_APLCA|nr:uncharacterized protein LOC101853808 [Aplysia californica]
MSRTSIPDGWLGAQPKMGELKMRVDSHRDAEFKVRGDNEVKIKLKTGLPVKVVTKLTQVSTDTDLPQFVLTQRKDKDSLTFYVAFPDNGFYKFQIFSLEESSESESLPNVYNYLVEVSDNYKPPTGYVKTYTKFYTDCCWLERPRSLHQGSPRLDDVQFELRVPGAQKVAVHCGEEWFHLSEKDGQWEGRADLDRYKGKDAKVTVNANYNKDDNSYSVLLEYRI